jgi:hypothetical protein
VRKEKQNDLAMEHKEENTSAVNEQGIVQGLLPTVHGARTMKKKGGMYKCVPVLKLLTICLRMHE